MDGFLVYLLQVVTKRCPVVIAQISSLQNFWFLRTYKAKRNSIYLKFEVTTFILVQCKEIMLPHIVEFKKNFEHRTIKVFSLFLREIIGAYFVEFVFRLNNELGI